jgi:uncharacterized protein
LEPDISHESWRVPVQKGKLFFVSFAPAPRHNHRVIGPFLNALGILLGALWGLIRREPPSAATQKYLQSALGAFTAFCGLQLVWQSTAGNFPDMAKQLFLTGLALVLGYWLGKILALQKMSNWLGRHATKMLSTRQTAPAVRSASGWLGITILFCAAPLGLVGAVTDGLTDYFYPLAIKGVMDGLAMTSFVKMFRWPVALAALPVFACLDLISLAAHDCAVPWLQTHALLNSVTAAAGLLMCAVALVILAARRVELANFLPALFMAPALTYYCR